MVAAVEEELAKANKRTVASVEKHRQNEPTEIRIITVSFPRAQKRSNLTEPFYIRRRKKWGKFCVSRK
jgi:hypothetical protein